MEAIELLEVKKKNNRIEYSFTVSERLRSFFAAREFVIEYDEPIESVPDAVAAVPFVCCVLPIVWLTDSKLIVSELDEAFFNCIPEVKKGYEKMFPESQFLGTLEIGAIVPSNRPSVPGCSAMLYSCGLDSMDTLYRHIEEKPLLVSIWGSDIRYDNIEGWSVVRSAINEAASAFHLSCATIRSTFREFDNERELSRQFSAQLKDGWWHGVKHGIALLGHVAPLAYLHGLENMYIASSNCPEDGHIRCASNPWSDNQVRYVNCRVFHDGFECSRQDKVRNIVHFSDQRGEILPLHVCWETQTGNNCCKCEKCYRTIAGLMAEGADPARYGFSGYEKYLDNMFPTVKKSSTGLLIRQWTKVQKAIRENHRTLKRSKDWKSIRWIETVDFHHPETIELPLVDRVKQAKGLRGKLAEFRFYQKLHDWKERLR